MINSMFPGWLFGRLGCLLAALLCSQCFVTAQPVLSTIQDTVYLADGSRFNGVALIDWRSFNTSNGSVIGQSGKVVQILDGVLRVQLAPTTNSNTTYYSVRYASGGRVLFSEIWAVPQSGSVLRLANVRAILLPGGFVSPPPGSGIGAPPIFGDIVGTGTFVYNESPAGTVNGSNTIFTLSAAPNPPTTLALYRNGLLQLAGTDFTLSGLTITFLGASVPQTGDTLRASFRTGTIGNSVHNLLSADHSDTLAEAVQRGDLISGQGAPVRWTRLPLGPANRCLVSNGQDAVWNTCLFTGFTPGQVPFVDSSGNLSQSSISLNWNSSTRRFGVGNSAPVSTLHVQDASPAGSTALTVQSSLSQGTGPLSRWLNISGGELARMDSDGALTVQRLTTSTTATRSAWRDQGNNTDPSSRLNGDFWFNTTQQARKSFEAGQVHPLSQVLCSSTGPSTVAPALTASANCLVPGSFFDAGDRLEVSFNVEHTGTASGFTLEMRIGNIPFWTRTFAANVPLAFTRASGGLHAQGIAWGINSLSSAGTVDTVSNVATAFTQSFIVDFRLTLNTAGTQDTLRLRNFSVIRYPAQSNPQF